MRRHCVRWQGRRGHLCRRRHRRAGLLRQLRRVALGVKVFIQVAAHKVHQGCGYESGQPGHT